jgi:hypothetical protein
MTVNNYLAEYTNLCSNYCCSFSRRGKAHSTGLLSSLKRVPCNLICYAVFPFLPINNPPTLLLFAFAVIYSNCPCLVHVVSVPFYLLCTANSFRFAHFPGTQYVKLSIYQPQWQIYFASTLLITSIFHLKFPEAP